MHKLVLQILEEEVEEHPKTEPLLEVVQEL
jgi:hypothetical protein